MLPEQTIKELLNPAGSSLTSAPPKPKSILYADESLDDEPEVLSDATVSVTTDKSSARQTSGPLLVPAFRPVESKFQLRFNTNGLESNEAIVQWIIKNKPFLLASFNNTLTHWVEKKLNTDVSFNKHAKALDLFAQCFKSSINNIASIDVRILIEGVAGPFSDVTACFIDAVTGLTDPLIRNQYILPNQNDELLRHFLRENSLIADCLAYGLPSLNDVAQIWATEHPDQLIQKASVGLSPVRPEVKALFQATSPKNPLPFREISLAERTLAVESANRSLRMSKNSTLLKLLMENPLPSVPMNVLQKENNTSNTIKDVEHPAALTLTAPAQGFISTTEKQTERKEEKSPGKLAAGSMNAFMRLAATPSSPSKRSHTESLASSPPSPVEVGSPLKLQNDYVGIPTILQRGKARRFSTKSV